MEGYVAAAWTQQDHLLMTGGTDQLIKIWDLSLGEPLLCSLDGYDGPIASIAISGNDVTFAAGTDSGTTYLYTLDQSLLAQCPDGKFHLQRM